NFRASPKEFFSCSGQRSYRRKPGPPRPLRPRSVPYPRAYKFTRARQRRSTHARIARRAQLGEARLHVRTRYHVGPQHVVLVVFDARSKHVHNLWVPFRLCLETRASIALARIGCAPASDNAQTVNLHYTPCAPSSIASRHHRIAMHSRGADLDARPTWKPAISIFKLARSEERRVGKECRSRWSPYH